MVPIRNIFASIYRLMRVGVHFLRVALICIIFLQIIKVQDRSFCLQGSPTLHSPIQIQLTSLFLDINNEALFIIDVISASPSHGAVPHRDFMAGNAPDLGSVLGSLPGRRRGVPIC